MDWAYLFEICLTGIASGGLYALAALAFVIVYKATRVVNIAIGEMLMAGAYLFFTFAAMFALPLLSWAWRTRQRQRNAWRDVVDPHLLPHLLEVGGGRSARAPLLALAALALD